MKNSTNRIKLESIEKKNIFSTPDNYFEKLSFDINFKVQKNSILTNQALKKSILKTPENYFDNLTIAIEAKTYSNKVLSESGLQTTIFTAPENYFDTLSSALQQKTTGKSKQSSLPVLGLRPAFRYAMAAVSLALLFLSSYWLVQLVTTEKTISNNYKVLSEIEVATIMTKLNNDDIREYLAYHEEDVLEAAINSDKNIYKELNKSIPLDKLDKEIIKEELELLDSDELEQELDLEL